jgi:D-alanine transaminase
MRDEGIAFEESHFSAADMRTAREAFISSATSFVKPIVRIDGMPVADGAVGRVTRRLFEIFARHVKGGLRNAA